MGGVTRGGDFCLDLVTGGALEVWAAPLTGGRIGVVLFNRSPAADVIACKWADVGAAAGRTYTVRDAWAAADVGDFVDSYTPPAIPAHGVATLLLTPK